MKELKKYIQKFIFQFFRLIFIICAFLKYYYDKFYLGQMKDFWSILLLLVQSSDYFLTILLSDIDIGQKNILLFWPSRL